MGYSVDRRLSRCDGRIAGSRRWSPWQRDRSTATAWRASDGRALNGHRGGRKEWAVRAMGTLLNDQPSVSLAGSASSCLPAGEAGPRRAWPGPGAPGSTVCCFAERTD